MNLNQRSRFLILLTLLTLGLSFQRATAAPAYRETPEPPANTTAPAAPRLSYHVYLSSVYRLYEAPFLPDSITPLPQVQNLLAAIDTSTLRNTIADLSGEQPAVISGEAYTLTTRNSFSGEPIQKATQYAYEHLQSFGLNPQFFDYETSYGTWRNVIADQPGSTRPGKIVIISAHIDSTLIGPNEMYLHTAPGADDNASGSAAVLLAAQLLSRYNFGCTVRYALFSGEEQGLEGSRVYAQEMERQGQDIQGVLNLDMIGFNSDDAPILDLHARPDDPSDQRLAQLFAEIIRDYELNLMPEIFTDGMRYSDHASFWDAGFPAILAIEDDDDFNPFYHSASDRLNKLDLDYTTEFARAAVAALAHLACPLPDTFN